MDAGGIDGVRSRIYVIHACHTLTKFLIFHTNVLLYLLAPIGITYNWGQEVEMLKEEVKKMLKEAKIEPPKQMNLIDTLQRLGVAYHFELEIEEAMKELHYDDNAFLKIDDLYTAALYFRLLKQQGYNAPCGKCILNCNV